MLIGDFGSRGFGVFAEVDKTCSPTGSSWFLSTYSPGAACPKWQPYCETHYGPKGSELYNRCMSPGVTLPWTEVGKVARGLPGSTLESVAKVAAGALSATGVLPSGGSKEETSKSSQPAQEASLFKINVPLLIVGSMLGLAAIIYAAKEGRR